MSSTSTLPLVLITGATGFVGAHVLEHAIDAGYPVRITARPAKVDALRKQFDGKVDVVGIADLASSDYTEAFKDVGAILHVAAPLPGRADAAGMISGAVDGSLNILRQAVKAGIKKIVITSSWVAVGDIEDDAKNFSDYVYTENDWNPSTREGALDGTHNAPWIYSAAKTVAEQEVWKFADQHPEIDVTSINPSLVLGPIAASNKVRAADLRTFSTVGMFYGAVFPVEGNAAKLTGTQRIATSATINIDVRDLARAHILALRAPPTSEVGRKRLLVTGPNFTWKDAVEYLRAARPELKSRLPDVSELVNTKLARTDVSRAEKVLGLGEYIDWKKTVEDSVDSILAIEKSADVSEQI